MAKIEVTRSQRTFTLTLTETEMEIVTALVGRTTATEYREVQLYDFYEKLSDAFGEFKEDAYEIAERLLSR